MTATRDRRSDPESTEAAPSWDARPMFGDRQGLPWWGAVLLALGLAVVGASVGLLAQGSLGLLFQACYLIGCVAAIGMVRRGNVFAPMVQPPLILAITVPTVVLLGSGVPAGGDTLATVLAVGTPLINGFPTMAITSALTLGLGFYRIYRERDPNRAVKPSRAAKRPASQSKSGSAAARRQAPPANRAQGQQGRRQPAGDRTSGSTQSRRTAPPASASGSGAVAGGRSRQAEPPARARPDKPARREGGEPRGGPRNDDPRAARGPSQSGQRQSRQPRAPRRDQGDRPRGEGTNQANQEGPTSARPRRGTPRAGEPPRARRDEPDPPRKRPQGTNPPPPRRSRRPWEDDAS